MNKPKSPSEKRREKEKLQRKNEIISYARILFAKNSYDGTSMDEIAKNTGFTKATLYNYFPNKDNLFLEVSSVAFKNFNMILKKMDDTPEPELSLKTFQSCIEEYMWNFPEDVFIIDSLKLRPLLINIINKESNKQELTEGEKIFRFEQTNSYNMLIKFVNRIFNNLNLSEEVNPDIIINILNQIITGLMVELVRREQLINQPREETSEVLSVFFRIFDQGLKNY
ncbi:MAG: TetR/AcrR family transcriptional regulator [Candidatus Hodarchaeales archaeon]|jgi:AcrR family transcriptional regulator